MSDTKDGDASSTSAADGARTSGGGGSNPPGSSPNHGGATATATPTPSSPPMAMTTTPTSVEGIKTVTPDSAESSSSNKPAASPTVDVVAAATSPKSPKSTEGGLEAVSSTSPATTAAAGGANEAEDDDDWTKLYENANHPLSDIKEPHDHDVLYGRGGGTNHHPGNKRYRRLVEGRKVEYVNSKRLEKPLVALDIIRHWRRDQNPPGRFLKVNEKTGLWEDVGDKKAREKTSQALREKAPILRKQQEEQEADNNAADNASNMSGTSKRRTKVSPGRREKEQPGGRDGNGPIYHDGRYGPPPPPDGGPYGAEPHPLPPPDIPYMEEDGMGITPIPFQRKEINAPNAPGRPTTKNTRFHPRHDHEGRSSSPSSSGVGGARVSRDVQKPNFGRIHSLGTELPDNNCLDGFSWEASADTAAENPEDILFGGPGGAGGIISAGPDDAMEGVPMGTDVARETSLESADGIYRSPAIPPLLQNMSHPPPTGRDVSLTSVGSFGSAFAPVQRSSSSEGAAPSPRNSMISRGSSDQTPASALDDPTFCNLKQCPNQPGVRRDHSLAMNPLRHATCDSAARANFERGYYPPHPHHQQQQHWSEHQQPRHQRDASMTSVGSDHPGSHLPSPHHPYGMERGYPPQQLGSPTGEHPGAYPPPPHSAPSSRQSSYMSAAQSERPFHPRQQSDQSFDYSPAAPRVDHLGPQSNVRSASDASFDYRNDPRAQHHPGYHGRHHHHQQHQQRQRMSSSSSGGSRHRPQQPQQQYDNKNAPPTPTGGLTGYVRQMSIEHSSSGGSSGGGGRDVGRRRHSSPTKQGGGSSGGGGGEDSSWPKAHPDQSKERQKRRAASSEAEEPAPAPAPRPADVGDAKNDRGSGDGGGGGNGTKASKSIPRPLIKRNTSHQNENTVTKKETKLRRQGTTSGPKTGDATTAPSSSGPSGPGPSSSGGGGSRSGAPRPMSAVLKREHSLASNVLGNVTLEVDATNIFGDEKDQEAELNSLPHSMAAIALSGGAGDEGGRRSSDEKSGPRDSGSLAHTGGGDGDGGRAVVALKPPALSQRSTTLEAFAEISGSGGAITPQSWLEDIEGLDAPLEELSS